MRRKKKTYTKPKKIKHKRKKVKSGAHPMLETSCPMPAASGRC